MLRRLIGGSRPGATQEPPAAFDPFARPEAQDIPALFVTRAVVLADAVGQPALDGGFASAGSFREIEKFDQVDIMIRDAGMGHYFHFVENLIVICAILFSMRRPVKVGRIFVGSQQWSNPKQNHVQLGLFETILQPAEVVSCQGEARFGSDALLVFDRALPKHLAYNKFFESAMEFGRAPVAVMKARALARVPKADVRRENSRAIYVKRTDVRSLSARDEAILLEAFSNMNLEVVDFAGMHLSGQVQLAHSARLMIGVHGNGLTNAMWMRPGSMLVELFPPGFHAYDYQFISELVDLQYFGLETDGRAGYVYTQGSRFGGAYGDQHVALGEVPWSSLAAVNRALVGAWA